MTASVNEAIFDQSVRHAIFLERFKGGEAKAVVAAYRELERDLLAQLARRDPTAVKGRYSRARMLKLLEDARRVISGFNKQFELDFSGRMRELAAFEAALQVKMLEGAVSIGLDWALPSVSQVRAAIFAEPMQGRLLKEWFGALDAVTQDRVKAAIRLGVLEGQGLREIGQRITGAVAMARKGAEMVARTAVNHVSQVARQTVFEENADIVKGVRWVATLDTRTSAVCRARDGAVYPLDSGPRPPAHPNCRSSVSPVLKSWKELGIAAGDAAPEFRASMDGQVPASVTYAEWLKRQSATTQDEILGKTKGALFRRGGLALDKFVMADGTELSLDGLRSKYPEAFVAAGRSAIAARGAKGPEELIDARLQSQSLLRWLKGKLETRVQFLRELVLNSDSVTYGIEKGHPLLAQDELLAVRAYTSSAKSTLGLTNIYTDLNSRLRKGDFSPEVQQFAGVLHLAIDRLPTAAELGLERVYAGKPAIQELFDRAVASLTLGESFEFGQFQSSSKRIDVAKSFAGIGQINGQQANGIIFRIKSPGSAHDVKSASSNAREDEMLVPYGKRFRVLAIAREKGYIFIDLQDDERS